jgi:hypothetical protein
VVGRGEAPRSLAQEAIIDPYNSRPEYANFQSLNLTEPEYANFQSLNLIEPEYANFQSLNLTEPEYANFQSLNLTEPEYANFHPLGVSDTEPFYPNLEGQTVTLKKNRKKETSRQIKESTVGKTSAEEINYAELNLTQSNDVNVLNPNILDTGSASEYCYLSADNKLISISNRSDQDEALGTAQHKIQGAMSSGVKDKVPLRKKKKVKNNPGSLSAEFTKLEIQPIQEEEAMLESTSSSEEKKPSLFSFFLKKLSPVNIFDKKSKQSTQEAKISSP